MRLMYICSFLLLCSVSDISSLTQTSHRLISTDRTVERARPTWHRPVTLQAARHGRAPFTSTVKWWHPPAPSPFAISFTPNDAHHSACPFWSSSFLQPIEFILYLFLLILYITTWLQMVPQQHAGKSSSISKILEHKLYVVSMPILHAYSSLYPSKCPKQ